MGDVKEKIGVSQAARLLKVARSEIQSLIKSGQLETFEGKVDIDDLRTLFPTMDVELNSVHRDLEFIRKAAYSNRVQSRLMPSRGDVQANLDKTRMQLLVEKQKATTYTNIMEELLSYMIGLRVEANEDERRVIDELSHWLVDKLEVKN